MPYNCPRCGYTCNQKGDIRKHFKRKKICSPSCLDIPIEECYEEVLGEKYEKVNESKCLVNESKCFKSKKVNESKCFVNESKCFVNVGKCFECRYCGKEFNQKQGRYQHEKKFCKEKGFSNEEVAELKSQISELRTQNANLLQKVGNTTNNTINNGNNTINIHLKAFGQENLSYISEDFIKDLIRCSLFSAIPKLLKEIHFNPEHTENRNTLIPSRKDALAKIYNGDRWDFTTKDVTLEDMTDKAFNKLTEYGSGPKFEKFYDAYDDQDTGYLKKIKKQTEIMILNNQ